MGAGPSLNPRLPPARTGRVEPHVSRGCLLHPTPSHPSAAARAEPPRCLFTFLPCEAPMVRRSPVPGLRHRRLPAVTAPSLPGTPAAPLLPGPPRLLRGHRREIQPGCGGLGWESSLFLPSSSTWRTHFLHAPNGWLAPRLCPGTKAAFMLWMPGF